MDEDLFILKKKPIDNRKIKNHEIELNEQLIKFD